MKGYTKAVVGTVRKSRGLLGFIRSDLADAKYYEGVGEGVRALWIEAYQLGSCVCYPCALAAQGEKLQFTGGRGQSAREKDENRRLLSAWRVWVYRGAEMNISELSREDLAAKLKGFKDEPEVSLTAGSEEKEAAE